MRVGAGGVCSLAASVGLAGREAALVAGAGDGSLLAFAEDDRVRKKWHQPSETQAPAPIPHMQSSHTQHVSPPLTSLVATHGTTARTLLSLLFFGCYVSVLVLICGLFSKQTNKQGYVETRRIVVGGAVTSLSVSNGAADVIGVGTREVGRLPFCCCRNGKMFPCCLVFFFFENQFPLSLFFEKVYFIFFLIFFSQGSVYRVRASSFDCVCLAESHAAAVQVRLTLFSLGLGIFFQTLLFSVSRLLAATRIAFVLALMMELSGALHTVSFFSELCELDFVFLVYGTRIHTALSSVAQFAAQFLCAWCIQMRCYSLVGWMERSGLLVLSMFSFSQALTCCLK